MRKIFSVPPLACNSSIIGDPVTQQAMVINPGGDHQWILCEIKQLGLTVTHILHTHAYFDRFLAARVIKKATGGILCVHHNDLNLWRMLEV